jgi:Icc-related predicted phosphoesterase
MRPDARSKHQQGYSTGTGSMRLIYVTDLHGNHDKYRRVLAIARRRGVDLVVNGGDLAEPL